MEKLQWRPDRVFGLSYVPSGEGTPPELVFFVEPGIGAMAEREILDRRLYAASDYLESRNDRWPGHQPGLFDQAGEREFGFGACGYVREGESGDEYHLPLTYGTVPQVALTLHLFAFALQNLVSDAMRVEPQANRAQLLDFMTRCDNHAHAGYGHATTGHIYPSFRSWLVRLGAEHEADSGHVTVVEEAMADVYQAVAHPKAREFASDCRARVNGAGRFLLECPGNACDIAIYPDGDYGNCEEYEFLSNFSCHNLDAAEQQLTLLAGLAVLHDLAVKDLG